MTARVLVVSLALSALVSSAALAQQQPQNPAPAQGQQPNPAQPARANPQRPSPQPATTSAPGTPAPAATPERAPRREGQPVNIKVEVTITDQRGGKEAFKKTVTVVTGDMLSGFIRSSANYTGLGTVPLNVDASPTLIADNRIRLGLNLQYNLPDPTLLQDPTKVGPIALRTTDIHENLGLILENGKPIVAAQSADPVGDRQVTVEVKATILR